jgi:hypothetical protein
MEFIATEALFILAVGDIERRVSLYFLVSKFSPRKQLLIKEAS